MTDTNSSQPWESQPAGLQYLGLAGITKACLKGILRLIHFGDVIQEAKLLTTVDGNTCEHGLILTVNEWEKVGIKSGFSSGYSGEGPRGLATALLLLERHNVEINEYIVEPDVMKRLNGSSLLRSDIATLDNASPVRPCRYYDYIHDAYPDLSVHLGDNTHLHYVYPVSMPFRLLDARLMDIALDFFSDPDARLLSAFRRLEDAVRNRTSITGKSGNRLFSEAFLGDNSPLYWGDDDKSEHVAKANMFTAVFGAYRNPRAHREGSTEAATCLKELLLVNELYLLEAAASDRPQAETALSGA